MVVNAVTRSPITTGILFARNSADVSAQTAVIDELTKEMTSGARIATVEILGLADVGERRPGTLAKKRAEAVRKALIKRGVPAKMLLAQGFGKHLPAALAGKNPNLQGVYFHVVNRR